MKNFPDFIFINDTSIQIGMVNNVYRSNMESGVPKLKQINSTSMFNLQFDVSIDASDLRNFYEWFNNDLSSGSFWFIMNHPLTGEKVRLRFAEYDFSWRKIGSLMVSSFLLEGYYV